jgi:hypothetical protein
MTTKIKKKPVETRIWIALDDLHEAFSEILENGDEEQLPALAPYVAQDTLDIVIGYLSKIQEGYDGRPDFRADLNKAAVKSVRKAKARR